LPLVADIHFNYKLALIAAKSVDCIRFNPGNISDKTKIKETFAIEIPYWKDSLDVCLKKMGERR
jgi:4-hydroxy-3-methylbut-2-en-1-yl diphosphate synthase IspG/GcpE